MLLNILSLITVSILWGCTNPFIKLGSQGIEQINSGSSARNAWLELKTVALRLKYWVPFLLNQFGSVLYVWTLQSCNMTVTVPVANSLTFVFTAITGYLLGESLPAKNIIVGTLLVCIGSFLLLYDQIVRDTSKLLELQ